MQDWAIQDLAFQILKTLKIWLVNNLKFKIWKLERWKLKVISGISRFQDLEIEDLGFFLPNIEYVRFGSLNQDLASQILKMHDLESQ